MSFTGSGVTYTDIVKQGEEITLDKMFEAIKTLPAPLKKVRIEISRKFYKKLETQLKERPDLSGFSNLKGYLGGIAVTIRPYLKKVRIVEEL